MLKVTAQHTEDCQAIVRIEVDEQRLEHYLQKAYHRLVKRTEVPGFRRGKAPRPMLERYLGRHRLLHEALDILVPEVVQEALREQGIEPYDRPLVEVVQEEPPIIQATVPLTPQVDLGDYLSLRLPQEEVTVDPAEVEAALQELRHRYALRQPVDRPARWGDIVRLDVRGLVDGRPVLTEEDIEVQLREGQELLVPGLAHHIIGLRKGEERTFTLTIPQDWPRRSIAGRQASFTVRIHEVKEEELPPLDDDFARQVGEGFPTLEALRRRLEEDIRQQKEEEASRRRREQAVDLLVESAPVLRFPPVLLEEEIERLLEEEARALGRDVDRYIQEMRRSPAQRRQELEERARRRLCRSLALSRLAELENIQVTTEEVTAEIERLTAGPHGAQLRPILQSPRGMESVRRSLLTRKTIDRLMEIVSGKAQPEGGEGT
jgi:trigger factor